MKYLKSFENHSQYETYTADTTNFIKPNVSLCRQENEVHYSPLIDSMVVAKFNITNTSNPTKITNDISGFTSIEIDGVEQPSVVSAYTFDTIGEHTVKYTLTNPTSIGILAFDGCTRLTSIIIPNTIKSIDRSAFYECMGLTSCTIGGSVTSIGEYAFYYCVYLTNIDIPDSVTSIGNGAFYNCISITSCTIGNSVTSIGESAFQKCSSLTSVTIPSSVTSIGSTVFYNCNSLTRFTIEAVVPPLLGPSALTWTNSCPIYVPSGSVDTYKMTDGWNDYASRIQAIS